jgi:hypothetical protein
MAQGGHPGASFPEGREMGSHAQIEDFVCALWHTPICAGIGIGAEVQIAARILADDFFKQTGSTNLFITGDVGGGYQEGVVRLGSSAGCHRCRRVRNRLVRADSHGGLDIRFVVTGLATGSAGHI